MNKDNKMNVIGMFILVVIFILFFIITNFELSKKEINKQEIEDTNKQPENINYEEEKKIVEGLYKNSKVLYDVVNNKFKVDQNDVIKIGEIDYKKIINFDEVMTPLFTNNGIDKYIADMGSYFAKTESGYYLAGNLVSYQTYYFRGDESNIYILSKDDSSIDAIIYEQWKSNDKNTLATIKVVKANNKWLIDDITILSND